MTFHRIIISKQSDDDLKQNFKYELPSNCHYSQRKACAKGRSPYFMRLSHLCNTAIEKSKGEAVDGKYLLHKAH